MYCIEFMEDCISQLKANIYNLSSLNKSLSKLGFNMSKQSECFSKLLEFFFHFGYSPHNAHSCLHTLFYVHNIVHVPHQRYIQVSLGFFCFSRRNVFEIRACRSFLEQLSHAKAYWFLCLHVSQFCIIYTIIFWNT